MSAWLTCSGQTQNSEIVKRRSLQMKRVNMQRTGNATASDHCWEETDSLHPGSQVDFAFGLCVRMGKELLLRLSFFVLCVAFYGNTEDDYDAIILESPVHPVTEGDPVTLSCRDKNQNLLSKVFFCHNDKLISNDSREELKISAVSKSDEGFYKCQHSGKESPSSWMSVRVTLSSPVSSSRLLLIIGPISGIILIIFLLLLWRYRRPKDLCSFRSDKNNQRSTTNHRVEIEMSDNNSPSQGDALYASVKPSEATTPAEPKEITYTMIKFKKLRKKRKPRKPEERVVYAEVKPRAAELAPTYAVVNKSKAKKNRKEKPAATNEPVYSEIKSGATLNDESAL